MTDSSLFVDAGAGKWLPVVTNTYRSNYLRQDHESQESRKASPATFVVPDTDKVILSSPSRDNDLTDGKKFPVCGPATGMPGIFIKQSSQHLLAVSDVGIPVNGCEMSPAKRSVAPCGLGANQKAIRRYGEASALRTSNSSTFEITA